MKYKLFEEYVEEENDGHPGFYETEEEIHSWLNKNDNSVRYDRNKYTINDDWSVDCNQDVRIWNTGDEKINYIRVKFNEVHGHFDCSENYLRTLKGAPNIVHGDFDCWENALITLQYAPDVVVRDFKSGAATNDLITYGHKSKIKGEFDLALEHEGFYRSLNERWNRYINYINALDEEEKKSSLQWLYDVDEDFHKLIAEYVIENNIDIVGLNKDIASDALKHKDSGLF